MEWSCMWWILVLVLRMGLRTRESPRFARWRWRRRRRRRHQPLRRRWWNYLLQMISLISKTVGGRNGAAVSTTGNSSDHCWIRRKNRYTHALLNLMQHWIGSRTKPSNDHRARCHLIVKNGVLPNKTNNNPPIDVLLTKILLFTFTILRRQFSIVFYSCYLSGFMPRQTWWTPSKIGAWERFEQ